MTVCAFIHPAGLPTLITDCVVTNGAAPHETTPSKINGANIRTGLQFKDMVSKRIFLSDHSVISFAGNAADIILAARDLVLGSSKFDAARPMRSAGDIINQQMRYGRDVQALGFDASPTNDYVNIVAPSNAIKINTKHFNECYFIGSGANDLAKLVQDFDTYVLHNPAGFHGQFRLAYAREALYGLLGALNGAKLNFSDEVGHQRSWGGYLEAWTFHIGRQSFVTMPSFMNASGLMTSPRTEPFLKTTAYVQTPVASFVMSNVTTERRDETYIFLIRTFDDYFAGRSVNFTIPASRRIDRLTLSYGNGSGRLGHRTLDPNERSDCAVEVVAGRPTYEISPALLAELSAEMV